MKTYKEDELKVFISHRNSTCGECNEELGSKAWITLTKEKGALCLACADLDHLVFLSSGDAALTIRSKKYSTLSAVVLKWSRARKRYERQGLLVENEALEKAERECLSDSESRERRRERTAERNAELDREYVDRFGKRILELFPGCSAGRHQVIAEHACRKYSGRVGRTAMAKQLDADAIRLAVIAHIRHAETNYDELLVSGYERWEARAAVADQVAQVLSTWENQIVR
jgi:hypothetical protein